MPRILLIEDDPSAADLLSVALGNDGFEVDSVRSAGEGLELAASQNYDLVVLDLTLPDQSGIDMLRMFRTRSDTPVLVLSALWDIDAKLTALAVGADDYVTKPFQLPELLARIAAVLRRAQRPAAEMLVAGRVGLDVQQGQLVIDSQPVHVTPKELCVLEQLLRSKDKVVAKSVLTARVFGSSEARHFRSTDVLMSTLRRKLAAFSNGATLVETVWGEGYVLRTATSDLAIETA